MNMLFSFVVFNLLITCTLCGCGFDSIRGNCENSERCEIVGSESSRCVCDGEYLRLNETTCEPMSCHKNIRCGKNEECGEHGQCLCLPGYSRGAESSCEINMCRDEIDCHALGMMYADEVSVLRDHVSDVFDEEGHLKCAGRSLRCGVYCDTQTCCRMPNECDNITSANCSTSNAIWCPHKCDRNSSSSCTETDLGENLDVPHRKSWVRGRILNPFCTASSTLSTLKDRLSIWYVFAASSSFSRAH